jgi:sulfatase maturation enzyme AslB (radical SAM superfamily)
VNLEKEKNIEEWISRLHEDPVTIDGYGVCSRKELDYYYKKYLILKANGHFETIPQEKRLSAGLKPDDIKKSLANTRQITLEITDRCGLQCDYCGYGKFYNDYDKRTNKDMDISSAVQLLNFLQKLWNSPLNRSHDKNIYLSFYGGEPLLHFPFIKELMVGRILMNNRNF